MTAPRLRELSIDALLDRTDTNALARIAADAGRIAAVDAASAFWHALADACRERRRQRETANFLENSARANTPDPSFYTLVPNK